MAKEYLVVTISPGIFSGNLNAQKLQRVLNDQALSDWKFSKSIADTRTYLLIFRRQAHFLIFGSVLISIKVHTDFRIQFKSLFK